MWLLWLLGGMALGALGLYLAFGYAAWRAATKGTYHEKPCQWWDEEDGAFHE